MKKLSFLFLLITITIQLKATTPIYNKDGIELTQNTIKEKIVFCNALNRNIIVWKSIVTIKNTTQEAVNILRPVYLKFSRGFLTNSELTIIRNQNIGYNVTQNYKNILTNSNQILMANQLLTSEKYFVTFDDIDLSREQYSWDLQYIK